MANPPIPRPPKAHKNIFYSAPMLVPSTVDAGSLVVAKVIRNK